MSYRARLTLAVGALLAIAAGAAPTPAVEIRSFSGTGSLDVASPVEVYLLAGTYHHRLVGTLDCYTTASLFPTRGDRGVVLSDVLQADLSVGRRSGGEGEPDPAGRLVISQPGWARLEVGTGPECPWTYSITGRFLAQGDEPVTQAEQSLWWAQIAAVAVLASLAVLALRRKSPKSREDEETTIRLIDPANDD